MVQESAVLQSECDIYILILIPLREGANAESETTFHSLKHSLIVLALNPLILFLLT